MRRQFSNTQGPKIVIGRSGAGRHQTICRAGRPGRSRFRGICRRQDKLETSLIQTLFSGKLTEDSCRETVTI